MGILPAADAAPDDVFAFLPGLPTVGAYNWAMMVSGGACVFASIKVCI